MESLALFASLIISLTALGGPISLALTFLPQRLLPLAVIKILAFLIAIIAIFIGVFGVTTAIIAIYRVIKVIPKI